MKVNKLLENDNDTHNILNDAAHKYPLILSDVPYIFAFITDLPKKINNTQLFQLVNMSFDLDTLNYIQMLVVTDQDDISRHIWQLQRHNISLDRCITNWKQFCNHVNSRIPTNDFED